MALFLFVFFLMIRLQPRSTLFPYTTLFRSSPRRRRWRRGRGSHWPRRRAPAWATPRALYRSEEHTSELPSPDHLVCRLLLEKKKEPVRPHLPEHKKRNIAGRKT